MVVGLGLNVIYEHASRRSVACSTAMKQMPKACYAYSDTRAASSLSPSLAHISFSHISIRAWEPAVFSRWLSPAARDRDSPRGYSFGIDTVGKGPRR